MDQQYMCSKFCSYMIETVPSQAYDAIFLDSVQNCEIISIIENNVDHIIRSH